MGLEMPIRVSGNELKMAIMKALGYFLLFLFALGIFIMFRVHDIPYALGTLLVSLLCLSAGVYVLAKTGEKWAVRVRKRFRKLLENI